MIVTNPNQRRRSSIVVVTQVFIIIALISASFLYQRFYFEPHSLIYPSCVVLFALTFWSFCSWKIFTKNWLDPYTIFLAGVSLFNSGQAILEVFHLNKNGFLRDTPGGFGDNTVFHSDEIILKALFLVTLSIASLHLGAMLSIGKEEESFSQQKSKRKVVSPTQREIGRVGWTLQAISFLPAISVTKDALILSLTKGYEALYQQDFATGVEAAPLLLANFIVPAAFFIIAGSKGKIRICRASAIIIIIYSITQLLIGRRREGTTTVIALAWIWNNLVRPLPKALLLVVSSLFVFLALPLIAATRVGNASDRLSLDALQHALAGIDNPVVASIAEMGFTMNTVAWTIELVPSTRDFSMGVTYFYAFLAIIPKLYGDLHPTQTQPYGTPSAWLVEKISPAFAQRGGGYGISFIAEAFLNFGWFGTPIVVGVIGFLLGKLTISATKSGEPLTIAALASLLAFFIPYARDETSLIVRPLVWYVLIPYLWVSKLSSLRVKNSQQRQSESR